MNEGEAYDGGFIRITKAKLTRLQAEVERLREQTRWIPVEERFPNFDEDVLAIDADRDDIGADLVTIVKKNYLGAFDNADAKDFEVRHYTHWKLVGDRPASPSSVKETKK